MNDKYLYKVYTETADRFAKNYYNGGWTSGSWGGLSGRNCLVGGLNRTLHEKRFWAKFGLDVLTPFVSFKAEAALPPVILDELIDEIQATGFPVNNLWWKMSVGQKQSLVISFNDRQGRQAVIDALRRCAARHNVKAEIERLRARITELKTRIAQLESDNHRLKLQNEVLQADRDELLKLDSELKGFEQRLLQPQPQH